MKYNSALDGLRAVAISLVLISHFIEGPLEGAGTVGVDLFFALSGYLITSILLNEQRTAGRIDLTAFYVRRMLRIWPALFVLLGGYCVYALLSSTPYIHLRAALAAAVSAMNWMLALGIPEGYVGHAWSLSIEEQFYLVWPAVLAAVMARRLGVTRLLIVVIAVVIVWRGYLVWGGANTMRIYAGTDTHADPILIGCLLASITIPKSAARVLCRLWFLPFIALLAIALIPAWSGAWFSWAFTATGLIGAWLIIVVVNEPRGALASILSHKVAVWLGKRSYSLYLYHLPVLLLVGEVETGQVLLVVSLSLLAAWASYKFIEQPFLKFKPQPASASPPRAITSVSAPSGAKLKTV